MSIPRPDGPPRPGVVLSITSFANPRIKDIKALALPKNRRQSGLFLAEGLKLVTDALASDWPMKTLIHAAEVGEQAAVQRAAATARARGADIISASTAVLAKIARRDNPQMVVGVFAQRLAAPDRIEPRGTWVALEGVKDPGNLGTIIRTVDSVGAEGVILVGDCVDPFGVEAVRATMGSIFHVPIARVTADQFLRFRDGWPGSVIGTHLSATADYRRADYRQPLLLMMGNEQSGLSDRLAGTADQLVRIPTAGRADSLNLAVATAVMLYEIHRGSLPIAAGDQI